MKNNQWLTHSIVFFLFPLLTTAVEVLSSLIILVFVSLIEFLLPIRSLKIVLEKAINK